MRCPTVFTVYINLLVYLLIGIALVNAQKQNNLVNKEMIEIENLRMRKQNVENIENHKSNRDRRKS